MDNTKCCHCQEPIGIGGLHVCFDCGDAMCRKDTMVVFHKGLHKSVEICRECARRRLNEALMKVDLPMVPKALTCTIRPVPDFAKPLGEAVKRLEDALEEDDEVRHPYILEDERS